MRVLLILLPFLVSPFSAIAADHEPSHLCESRLEAPAMALARIVEMAFERKLIDPVRMQQAFADGRFANPFTPTLHAQYRRAFATWEGQLNDAQKQIFRDRIAGLVAKNTEDAKRSDRAKTETAVVFNPKVIDQTGVAGIGEYAMTWLDGRPIFFDYLFKTPKMELIIFDPFAPDSEARLRYLPIKNSPVVMPAHFHWQGHDYVLLSKEKKIFDLRTLEDVSEKFAAERIGRVNQIAGETVVVNRPDGPYSITSMFIPDGDHGRHYGLLGVSLAHPEKPNENLFGENVGTEKIKWLKKFNLDGREVVAVQIETRMVVWDGKSGQRFPNILSYDLADDAKFFVFKGRMACAYGVYDPQGMYGIRIVDVENGNELKLIPQLTTGSINVIEHRGKQWLTVTEPRGYMMVNLEDDTRHEVRGVDPVHSVGVSTWEGEEYILAPQTFPPALSIASPSDDRALVHPLQKAITKLEPFNYQGEAYALVEFKGDRTASILKLFNPL